jgi:hypothetical protein
MTSSKTSDVSSLPDPQVSPVTQESELSIGKKILSFIFGDMPGKASGKGDRELRMLSDEDKLDIPRTEQEEKERQARIKRRGC